MNPRGCIDCVTEALARGVEPDPKKMRATPYPGPRCHTHHLARQRERKKTNHARTKEQQFGLPPGGYAKMLDAQDGACGGCGKVPGPRARRLAVDHDHACCPGNESCGQCVRGLLCYDCNDTLRRFHDDPEGLRMLAHYLEDWPSRHVDWDGKLAR